MFVEDLAPFFSTADFASAATWNGAPVNGIFDRAYSEPLGNVAEAYGPVFQCAAADVPTVAHGDALIVDGAVYTVRGVEPDGTGVVLLRLEIGGD
jgi:hypothetical protein